MAVAVLWARALGTELANEPVLAAAHLIHGACAMAVAGLAICTDLARTACTNIILKAYALVMNALTVNAF
jgi:hypothetical protein